MSKTYNPGAEADAIIERQLAKGAIGTGDEVVRAGVRLLEEQEAELEELKSSSTRGTLISQRAGRTVTQMPIT
jgi:putative addiction module CopG family antidote